MVPEFKLPEDVLKMLVALVATANCQLFPLWFPCNLGPKKRGRLTKRHAQKPA